jgi:hypothetical protein
MAEPKYLSLLGTRLTNGRVLFSMNIIDLERRLKERLAL